jgi:hypothetical protein
MLMPGNKGVRAVGSILVGLAMIWLGVEVEYLLALSAGWIVLDVMGISQTTRRLYLLVLLVGSLWYR